MNTKCEKEGDNCLSFSLLLLLHDIPNANKHVQTNVSPILSSPFSQSQAAGIQNELQSAGMGTLLCKSEQVRRNKGVFVFQVFVSSHPVKRIRGEKN
jgi:hypothetical protein